MKRLAARLAADPRLRRYASLVREDMTATYARDLRKWLIVAPILGVATGLLITAIIEVILRIIWPRVLALDLAHPAAIVPTLTLGLVAAGLIMQYLTPDPDEHSTEEIIRAYHERDGRIDLRPFVPKLLAAVATVGLGGSAALEGPSVYGGGALGSWLWSRLRFAKLTPRDRRILLISGAAAGMSAVFRAPLTGIVFALEMPYKDDLAHEALLPSLIASVVAYATMAAFVGSSPVFDFIAAPGYSRHDLWWSAALGAACGLVVMTFNITFRRFREFARRSRLPHWGKMAAGGALTGVCGLAFVSFYRGTLIPIGPNYEAVAQILRTPHPSSELLVFSVLKLAATLFSLGVGGVSAMFVPLFLVGGAVGTAFAQSIVHAPVPQLFAAVGMAAFIAGGYKTPLTAVVFVAEATGGHAFIVPTLVGAAVAYAVSGESSVSGDQRLHETVPVAELLGVTVGDVMRRDAAAFDPQAVRGCPRVPRQQDLQGALRLLLRTPEPQLLVVTGDDGAPLGVVTAVDILTAIDRTDADGPRRESHPPGAAGAPS